MSLLRHQAVYYGHNSIARFLMDCGANVGIQAKNGCTAFDIASIIGDTEIVRVLATVTFRGSGPATVVEEGSLGAHGSIGSDIFGKSMDSTSMSFGRDKVFREAITPTTHGKSPLSTETSASAGRKDGGVADAREGSAAKRATGTRSRSARKRLFSRSGKRRATGNTSVLSKVVDFFRRFKRKRRRGRSARKNSVTIAPFKLDDGPGPPGTNNPRDPKGALSIPLSPSIDIAKPTIPPSSPTKPTSPSSPPPTISVPNPPWRENKIGPSPGANMTGILPGPIAPVFPRKPEFLPQPIMIKPPFMPPPAFELAHIERPKFARPSQRTSDSLIPPILPGSISKMRSSFIRPKDGWIASPRRNSSTDLANRAPGPLPIRAPSVDESAAQAANHKQHVALSLQQPGKHRVTFAPGPIDGKNDSDSADSSDPSSDESDRPQRKISTGSASRESSTGSAARQIEKAQVPSSRLLGRGEGGWGGGGVELCLQMVYSLAALDHNLLTALLPNGVLIDSSAL